MVVTLCNSCQHGQRSKVTDLKVFFNDLSYDFGELVDLCDAKKVLVSGRKGAGLCE